MNKIMQERTDFYQSKNNVCGKNGYIYDKKEHRLFTANCKQFSCGHCRQIEIKKLMKRVVKTARHYNLTRHLVITVPGKDFRDQWDADESFYKFSDKFNEFKTLISQKYFSTKTYVCWEDENGELQKRLQFIPWGDFHYIGLRRSQKDGYCHLHALIGCYIPMKVLIKFAKQVGFGHLSIDFIDIIKIHNYLAKYWYKDHEWYIPKNMRHVTKSQSIEWITNNDKDRVKRWFIIMNDNNDSKMFANELEMMYTEVMALSGGYPLPLDYVLSKWATKKWRNQT